LEGGMDASPLLASGEPGALERLESAEDVRLLRVALGSLDEDQRRALELVDIEELSYAQAALVLKLPVNTVRSRLNRGRARLKDKLVRLRSRLGEKS
ncbi:MAG: RNA polymerase sigma factor, partial [bacterium]